MARRPLKREWVAVADVAERRIYLEVIGNASVAAPVRNLVAKIITPLTAMLRREGLRNGPLAPLDDAGETS